MHVLKGLRLLQLVQEQPNAAAAAVQRTPHLDEPRRHLREIGSAPALARVEEVSVGRAHLKELKRNSVVNVDIMAIICVAAIAIANSVFVIVVSDLRAPSQASLQPQHDTAATFINGRNGPTLVQEIDTLSTLQRVTSSSSSSRTAHANSTRAW